MYDPCEDTAETAWEKSWDQGEKDTIMRVINNLLRAGKDIETSQIATGWTKEQIARVVQPLMY